MHTYPIPATPPYQHVPSSCRPLPSPQNTTSRAVVTLLALTWPEQVSLSP